MIVMMMLLSRTVRIGASSSARATDYLFVWVDVDVTFNAMVSMD